MPNEKRDPEARSDVEPLEDPIQSVEAGRRKRKIFEAWKSGVVHPLREPASLSPNDVHPAPVHYSAISPNAIQHRGSETPRPDLGYSGLGGQGSRLPVSVDARASVDMEGLGVRREELDERELERRLRELEGLSPVSDVSGLGNKGSTVVVRKGEATNSGIGIAL